MIGVTTKVRNDGETLNINQQEFFHTLCLWYLEYLKIFSSPVQQDVSC